MRRMFGRWLLFFCLLLAADLVWLPDLGWAQAPSDCHAAPNNLPNAGYPRVCSDYRVIFKLLAPNARKVQMWPSIGASGNGMGDGYFNMTKGPDGVWTLVHGPVRPGFHYYVFLVDGLVVNDPGTNVYSTGLGPESVWGLSVVSSGIEVRQKGVDFDLIKDVPHGVISEFYYKAKVTNEYRRAFVYTPPGYDKSLTTRYPVLYLSHGAGNDENSWMREGHLGAIMDNLLAEKKIVPMLVVMDYGYSQMHQTSEQNTVPYKPALYMASEEKSWTLYPQIAAKDLVPAIDAQYRTIPGRESRMIAGLSHGSQQSLYVGLKNLDIFANIGLLSPAKAARDYFANPTTYDDGMLNKPDLLNSKLKLLWMGDGTAEGGHKEILRFHQALEKNGVRHVFFENPGTAHEWMTWRRHLLDLAPRLFRN